MKTLEIKNSAILEILQSIFQYKYLFYVLLFFVFLAATLLWALMHIDQAYYKESDIGVIVKQGFILPNDFYSSFTYTFINMYGQEVELKKISLAIYYNFFLLYIPIYFLYKSVSERLCPVSKPALRDFLEILIVVLLYESCTIFYIIQHHYWFIICPFLFVFACDAFYLSLIAFIRRLLIKLGINNPLKGIPVFIVSTIIILNFLRWFHS